MGTAVNPKTRRRERPDQPMPKRSECALPAPASGAGQKQAHTAHAADQGWLGKNWGKVAIAAVFVYVLAARMMGAMVVAVSRVLMVLYSCKSS